VRQVMEYYLAVRMRRVGSAYGQDTSHLQRVEPSRLNGRSMAPMNSPIVPRPALVAGGGRPMAQDGRTALAQDTRSAMNRSPLSPRLRPIRDADGH